jgi:hypothetical protein
MTDPTTTPSPDETRQEVRKYRKRPVVIEAMRFAGTPQQMLDIAAWCGGRAHSETKPSDRTDIRYWLDIPTLEGVMTASPGDWIIRGVRGEFYPCKPDIFVATYEPAALPAAAPDEREGDGRAVRDVLAECDRQVAKGYTAEHDDAHGAVGLAGYAHRYLNRAIDHGNRSDLVAATALGIKAIEAVDRTLSFEGTDGIAAAVERSSFGTPDAQAARATVGDETAVRIVARSHDLHPAPTPVVSREARDVLDALRGEVEAAVTLAVESLGTVRAFEDTRTDEIRSSVTLDPNELPSRVWHEFKATALRMPSVVTMADFIDARDAADAQFSGPSGGQWALVFLAALGLTVADEGRAGA